MKHATSSFYVSGRNRFLLKFFMMLLLFVGWSFGEGWGQTSPQTITTSGTWTCPTNVYSVQVECWGGGGAGGSAKGSTSYRATGGGGAGGAYAKSTIAVTPGTVYTVTVGAASTSSASSVVNGNPTWFGSISTVYAQGGAGGASVTVTSAAIAGAGGVGSSSSSIGSTLYKGGDGYMSLTPATSSAGGGGSAGTSSNGNSSTSQTGGTAVTGGGAGGNGPSSGNNGNNGSVPGGGGGGAYAAASTTQRTGGNGAAGKVVLTWTAVSSFTVTYDANGGNGLLSDTSNPYNTGSTVTTLSNNFTRTGYTFTGWNTVANGTGTAYAEAASFTINANTTLYAQWSANNNTITFDGNGNTGGSMSTQTIATAASANLNSNLFEKTGYTFAGWATSAGGVVAYANGANYTMGTGNVTLYAKWTPNNNTVTFDGNGSTGGSMSGQTIATDASANLTSNTFTRTGYSFNGWNTAADGSGTSYANGASYAMGTGNVTLYAIWSEVTTPTITVSGTIQALSTTYGTASSAASFNVSGSALSSDILITPPAGFEVSQTSGGASGYTSTQTLTRTGGNVALTTIYVRLAATTLANTYSGNVVISNGEVTQNNAIPSSTVSPYTLTVSGLSGVNKVYDGTTTASLTGTEALSSTVNSDVITLTGTAVGTYTSASAANNKTINISGLSLSGTNVGSYSLTAPTTTANITAAPLTITGISISDKVYNGNTAATITGTAAYSGLVNGETFTVTGSPTAIFADANVNTNISVTVSGYSAPNSNYSITQPTGLTGAINKASQTITLASTGAKNMGDADYSPATASSGLTVTYQSSDTNVASIVSGNIHIVGAGTATITASQAGDGNYNAASDVQQTLTVTLNSDYFRSKASGNWNATSTWETSTDGSTGWAAATKTPGATNTVYIQSGHTVTLTQNESCGDLHIANSTSTTITSSSLGKITLSTFTLSVNGKLRTYYAAVGSVPGTSASNGFSVYPFTVGTGGKVSIIGNTRNLTTSGEWGAVVTTPATGAFPLEINLTNGQTATIGTSIKCTSLNINTGILDMGAFTVGLDNGTTGQGDCTISSGATLASSASTVLQRTGSTRAGTFTLNSGSTLILSGASQAIAMSTLTLNGTVEYSKSGAQTLLILANSGASPNTYSNLKLSGSGVKKLGVATTINGNLNISGTASLDLNSFALNYGGSASLEYSGTSTQTSSIELPANINSLTINNNAGVSLTANTTIGSIAINSGSSLTLPAGKQLTISNSFTNNGTIILQSDSTGTATLLTPSTVAGSGTTTIQQYLTGTSSTVVPRGWWYIASPISNAKADVFIPNGSSNKFGYWDEPSFGYPQITDNQTALIQGKGYVFNNNSADGIISFNGTLNNGNIRIQATRTGTTDGARGFNLIGNPYPSYIDWSTVTKNNVRQTIWYRTWAKGGGGMTFDTFDGTVGTANGKRGAVSQYIPPMQGFWVKVNADGDTASVIFHNSDRLHRDQTAQTNRLRVPGESKLTPAIIRLTVSNGTNSDEAILVGDASASNAFDNYDSPKMKVNNTEIPEIFTIADQQELVINHLNSITNNTELPLGFRPGKTADFTITATEISNLDSNLKLFLKDNNNEYELTNGNSYSFCSDATATTSRFSIIFKSNSTVTSTENTNVNNVIINSTKLNGISITLHGNNNSGEVYVYDIMGKELITKSLKSGLNMLPSMTTGAYIVKISTPTGSTEHKVIVK